MAQLSQRRAVNRPWRLRRGASFRITIGMVSLAITMACTRRLHSLTLQSQRM
jgi:hypothetical protein